MIRQLRTLWRLANAPETVPTLADDARVMKVSQDALWQARTYNSPLAPPDQIFAPAQPMPGVVPSGMAMDDALPPSSGAIAAWGTQQLAHEGLIFLGYPYLAELAQRVEYRLIAEKRAEHATRKWIKVRGPDAKAKESFRVALTQDGLFGRSQIFMDFGDAEDDKELNAKLILNPAKINKSRPLKCLKIVEPMWSYPAPYASSNPLAQGFYVPSSWYVYGKTVDASRMMTFIGRPVPDMLKPAYAFGGLSMTQMLKPYVDNWLRARQSSSDLLNAFSTMVLKTDMSSAFDGGMGSDLYARVDMFNLTRSNRGTMVINEETEELENVAVPLSGVPDLTMQALEFLSFISGIPKVILFGDTPHGLNASSDDDIRIFYDDINANEQEHTAQPHVQMLLDVVQLSLFDVIDPEITWEWESLWSLDDTATAAIRKSDAEADVAYVNAGIVDPEEVRERLSNDETGLYQGVDLSGPPPEPPEVETAITPALNGKVEKPKGSR